MKGGCGKGAPLPHQSVETKPPKLWEKKHSALEKKEVPHTSSRGCRGGNRRDSKRSKGGKWMARDRLERSLTSREKKTPEEDTGLKKKVFKSNTRRKTLLKGGEEVCKRKREGAGERIGTFVKKTKKRQKLRWKGRREDQRVKSARGVPQRDGKGKKAQRGGKKRKPELRSHEVLPSWIFIVIGRKEEIKKAGRGDLLKDRRKS